MFEYGNKSLDCQVFDLLLKCLMELCVKYLRYTYAVIDIMSQ